MQISRKQFNTFNRINKKLRTVPIYFITNYPYLIKKYCYLRKPHYIIKCRLKHKRRKAIISFNQLIKSGRKCKSQQQWRQLSSKKSHKKLIKKTSTGNNHIESSLKKLKRKSKSHVTGDVIKKKGNDGIISKSCKELQYGLQNSKSNQSKVDDNVHPKDNSDINASLPVASNNATQNQPLLKVNDEISSKNRHNDERKDISSTSENVNDQIREQLKLLQSGRRTSISLLNSGKNTSQQSAERTSTSSRASTPSLSRHTSHSSLESEIIKQTDGKSRKQDGVTHTSQKPTKFIDSLINKLKTQGLNMETSVTDDSIISLSTNSSPEKSLTNVQSKLAIEFELPNLDPIIDDDQLSDHSTSSKNDFLGFQENETRFQHPNIPGMLPTPLVQNSKGVKSAFVSEELDNFMKENALDNTSYKTAPLKKRHDEAMMYAEAEPPSLLCPQLPSDVEKPRTVAEKRQLLERKADIKYLMIENESTVYRELRKRSRTGPVPNYNLIRNIQQMNIPFTRDCWRATCWLNTPNGRFYFQTINDHGKDVKVLSGKGNNFVKELCKLPSIKKKKIVQQDCSKSCKLIGNIKINGLDELISSTESSKKQSSISEFTSKKLNTLSDGYLFQKPGPLSLKKLNPLKSSIDVELGPLELYSLPRIQLQVWPKIDRPLPDIVYPYLKLALPYHKLTPEWAEFALSTLKPICPANRRKRKRTTEIKEIRKSFTFNIPYTNNQNRILVRKRRRIETPTMATLHSIKENEEAELSFMKNIDRSDDIAVAVADVLTGMINSVALTLCEGTVIKEDPDIDYTKVDGQIENAENKLVGLHTIDGKKKNTPSGKIVKELKKLNAKIIHGFDSIKKEECTNASCKLGCICDSLRGAQTYSYHCKEVKCMFQCTCPSSRINTSTFESAVHNSDIKQYCDRMNASLAKEEKDFTATVVVSDGKTIYVPTWDEKKKRNKKVPKRLSDCVQFESEFVHRDLMETLKTKEEKRMREKMEIVHVEETTVANENDIVKNMIHVNVNLERLNALDNLQPWCMVHCLYKCFCRFKAVEGERFEFVNTKIDMIEQPAYTKKRQYTFERNKDEPTSKILKVSKATTSNNYAENDDLCRRVCVVATTQHTIINAARSVDVRKRIRRIEQEHPGLRILLRNRVKRSTALPEIGPLVSVSDAPKVLNNSATSTESRSFAEETQSPPSKASFTEQQSVKEPTASTSTPINVSFEFNGNASRYRQRFNNIIMKTMQGISQRLKTKTSLPSPVNKALNCIQWKHFLQLFNADQIYIYEVQLHTQEVLLVVTDKNIMPIISNAIYVINIRAVSTERLPVLSKLIKLGIINEQTEKMSILLFGISNYWRILGCTHSENDFLNERVTAIPTPDANPLLASKIANLFDDMVQLKQKTQSVETRKPLVPVKSNICIRTLDEIDFSKIHVPIPVLGCHRWLMLSLANDFSHIFVPPWKHFLTYDKIQNAIKHANKEKKTVRMGPANITPHVYVPHNSDMKIFFGPMKKNEILSLQLLQHFDGKMLLREDYQRIAQPQRKGLTIGTWLYMKDDNMVVGVDSPENVEDNCQIDLISNESNQLASKRNEVPKLKFFTRPSLDLPKCMPLRPSAVPCSSANLNITLVPTASSSSSSKPTYRIITPTTQPVASTSTSVPSSEMIRQISLGLRARPVKVSTIVSSVTPSTSSTIVHSTESHASPTTSLRASQISFKDPSSLLSPLAKRSNNQFPSNCVISSTPTNIQKPTYLISASRVSTAVTSSLNKTITASLANNTTTNITSISREVPIVRSHVGPIRERRYTTFIPGSRTQKYFPLQPLNDRPQTCIKNFELQNSGNVLTLAPIPAIDSSSQVMGRPMNIENVKSVATASLLRQRSKTIVDTRPRSIQVIRPLSPSFLSDKRGDTKNNQLNSAINFKRSTAPMATIKPIHSNLKQSPVVINATTVSEGKSTVSMKGLVDSVKAVAAPALLRQRSKTIDTRPRSIQINRPLSPFVLSDKRDDVKNNSLESKLITKPSTAPMAVIKPIAQKSTVSMKGLMNPPAAGSTNFTSSQAKRMTSAKNLRKIPMLRPIPSNFPSNFDDTNKATSSKPPILTQIINCDDDDEPMQPSNKQQVVSVNSKTDTEYPIDGFLISQIHSLGKIMAKKLQEGYSVTLTPFENTKYFLNFKQCCEFLNNGYLRDRIFALVPAHLSIEWKFVYRDEDHADYLLHTDKVLKTSMVLTKHDLIDLHSDFDLNESLSMDLRHHLLVLKLANACMKNVEARHKTGLQIVKKSELYIKELLAESQRLESAKTALQIDKHLNTLKLSELQKQNKNTLKTNDKTTVPLPLTSGTNNEDIITIDSDDD